MKLLNRHHLVTTFTTQLGNHMLRMKI